MDNLIFNPYFECCLFEYNCMHLYSNTKKYFKKSDMYLYSSIEYSIRA